ncbi:hypothetical protein BH10ACT3_BH10ACT3_20840 [soil metagenome]
MMQGMIQAMSSIKIIESIVLVLCVVAVVWAVRARKTFYAVAAVIIAITILIDLAA